MTSDRPALTMATIEYFVREQVFGSGDPASAACSRDGVGIELEWLSAIGDRRLSERESSELIEAVTPLPARSRVTVEPGGQLELSTPPHADLDRACQAAATDLYVFDHACAERGIDLYALGADPQRRPERIVTSPRYAAMQEYFDAAGPAGRMMMCNTAAIQVNVGLGPSETSAARRWNIANALGPALTACFANSPFERGRTSGWKSTRLRSWWALDRSRSAPVPPSADPAAAWIRYALDAQVMLIRAGDDFRAVTDPLTFEEWMERGHELGWPTLDDFVYHLSTLFPPVRPRGWLEVRYIDALPTPFWHVATALVYVFLRDEAAGEEFIQRCGASTSLWIDAAQLGLAHPELAAAGRTCFEIALDALAGIGASDATVDIVGTYYEQWVARGRCPGDDRYDAFLRSGTLFPGRESPVPYAFDPSPLDSFTDLARKGGQA